MSSKEKGSFVLMNDWYDLLQDLSDEQRGRALTAIFAIGRGDEYDIDAEELPVRIALKYIAKQIKSNNEKYDEICEKRAEAGRRGGQASGSTTKQTQAKQAKEANADFGKQAQAKEANADFDKHTDTDSDTESDSDTDSETDIYNHQSSFIQSECKNMELSRKEIHDQIAKEAEAQLRARLQAVNAQRSKGQASAMTPQERLRVFKAKGEAAVKAAGFEPSG